MKIKNEEYWKNIVQKNQGQCGKGIIEYAERWANAMEIAMEQGETLRACAKRTADEANTEGDINGFRGGCAVAILARVWIYGEELIKWYYFEVAGVEEEE